MSTSFLLGYAIGLVHALLQQELLEIEPESEHAVIESVAAYMAENREGQSLISLTARALMASPHVIELYADNETLKGVVDGLGS